MAIRSISENITLQDAKKDYREGSRAEQYRLGREAIHFAAFPGSKYLPFTAVDQAWTQDSSITVTGTCGKALPVVVLRVRYDGVFYHTFTFEKQANADRVLEAMAAANPGVILAPEPTGEARRAMLAEREAAAR